MAAGTAGVQIWVVIDDGLSRQLKPITFDYVWESMEDIAAMRGLPVSWPELDEEELQLVDMRLVWGGFTDYLVERGAPADGVAIIAARREGPQWTRALEPGQQRPDLELAKQRYRIDVCHGGGHTPHG